MVAAVVGTTLVLAACGSTSTSPSSGGTGSAGSKTTIPAAAFRDRTGLTASSVAIGNVSTLTSGLFTGALVGTRAYAAYVNAKGGVDGRKITVDSFNDQFTGADNKQETQAAMAKDFALVGGISLQDSFGGTVLAANPQVPNVTLSISMPVGQLPNTFSSAPVGDTWQLGPLVYMKKKYPTEVKHVGILVASLPSAVAVWNVEHQAMVSEGYHISYEKTFVVTQTDFTQNVIAMRNAGVKMLFIDQLPENFAGPLLKDLAQQDFHPVVVLGASAYSHSLVDAAGGDANVDGANFEQPLALFLGEDSPSLPAIATFQTWVQKVDPGFKPDIFTLYGWTNTQLFVQALEKAGRNPSRGSVLQALRSVTSFSGDGLMGVANPAKKIPTNCYIVGKIEGGTWVRVDDPPVSGPTRGYRCDQPRYRAKP